MDVFPEAAFDSRVEVCGVPDDTVVLTRECRIEGIVGEETVSDSDVELGYDGVLGPRLETDEELVLEPGHLIESAVTEGWM